MEFLKNWGVNIHCKCFLFRRREKPGAVRRDYDDGLPAGDVERNDSYPEPGSVSDGKRRSRPGCFRSSLLIEPLIERLIDLLLDLLIDPLIDLLIDPLIDPCTRAEQSNCFVRPLRCSTRCTAAFP